MELQPWMPTIPGSMTDQADNADRGGTGGSAAARITLLGLLCCVILFTKLHTLSEPLQVDTGAYAVIGHELLNGAELYTDIWDHKPPAIHVTYALFDWLFGYGEIQLAALVILFSIASLLLLENLTRFLGGPLAGSVAAILWAFTCLDIRLQGNEPNTEVMINTMCLAAMVCYVRIGERGLRLALLAGLFLGLATLFKLNAVFLAVLLGPLLLLKRDSWRIHPFGLVQIAAMALPGILLWASVSGWFYLDQRFTDFFDAVITYNQAYAGSILDNFVGLFRAENLFLSRALTGVLPLLYFALAWALDHLLRRPGFRHSALALFGLAAALQVGSTRDYFEHYYQLLLPFLCASTALLWARLRAGRFLPARLPATRIARLLLLLLPLIPLGYWCHAWTLDPLETSRLKYGRRFVHSQEICAWLEQNVSRSDSLYHFGGTPSIYFYLDRRPISPYVFAFPFFDPDRERGARMARRMTTAIERERPEVVVAEAPLFNGTLEEWFLKRYRPVHVYKRYTVLRRI